MERSKKSAAWDHFTQISKDTVKCKLCSAELKYARSTGSMRNHLRLKHPSVPCDTQHRQPAPTTFTSGGSSRRCSTQREEELTDLLCTMITTDMLPVSFVEGSGFRALMSFVEPEYHVPARQALALRLEKRYGASVKALREQLDKASKVALTADCWTVLPAESYVTVTCHYIENWEWRSAVLQTIRLPEREPAAHLAEAVDAVVGRWGLAGRVLACVHDHTGNVALANSPVHVPWESINCFAHTLQLAINDGFRLAHMKDVFTAASKLVTHFHRSPGAMEALEGKQSQLQVQQQHPLQLCETRWSSVYDMFSRLSEQRGAITAVLSDGTVTKLSDACELQLAEAHWQLIEDILPVLSTLKCATMVMSSEQSKAISNVYPICNSLLQTHLKSEASAEGTPVAAFKNAIRASLERRMTPSDPGVTANPALIASLLDPRHKHMRFLPAAVQKAAKATLLGLASGLEAAEPPGAGPEPDGLTEPAPEKKASVMVLLLGEGYTKPEPEEDAVEHELESYFRDPCPSLECSPLEWWKANAQRFPRLAKLANGYLCIPGTSEPAERMFSPAGRTVGRLHSGLTPQQVDMCVFLNQNKQ
ncbi:E3 SUMO-protein ligase ZBED1-like isoform X2 [Carettochelys insculpta]